MVSTAVSLNATLTLSLIHILLRDWKVQYAPQSPDEPVHARFVEACRNLDRTEYYLDILCAGD